MIEKISDNWVLIEMEDAKNLYPDNEDSRRGYVVGAMAQIYQAKINEIIDEINEMNDFSGAMP